MFLKLASTCTARAAVQGGGRAAGLFDSKTTATGQSRVCCKAMMTQCSLLLTCNDCFWFSAEQTQDRFTLELLGYRGLHLVSQPRVDSRREEESVRAQQQHRSRGHHSHWAGQAHALPAEPGLS